MSADLTFDADERMIAESVAKFCAAKVSEQHLKRADGKFDRGLWRTFCEQGFFALGTTESEGHVRSIVACAESLGHALFPGPVFDTFLAAQVLEGDEQARLIEGELIVSSGLPPTLPFASDAQLHLGLGACRVTRLTVEGPIEILASLGGEPWGRAHFGEGQALPHAARGLFCYDVSLSAYLGAAARGLLKVTADHVATRKQFGRAVGSFQAVAHPLASCHIMLAAAQALSRAAAAACDEQDPRARSLATAALSSNRKAALETAYTCHQKLGAIGITVEGPAQHVTRRIRQLAARVDQRVNAEPALITSFGGGCE